MRRGKSAETCILSREQDLQLISLVRRWPALYDPEHLSYMDSIKKVAIWAKIGTTLAVDPKICRSRWYNIRDNYRKSVIRNHEKMRLGRDVKVYKYTGELGFLRAYFNLRLERDPALESGPDDGDGDGSDAQIEFVDELSTKSQQYEPSGKHVKLELDQEESHVSEPQAEPGALMQSDESHPVDSFLTYVGHTLKSLPPYFLSLAKAEIFATVHKYELKMLAPEGDTPVSSSDPLSVTFSRRDTSV